MRGVTVEVHVEDGVDLPIGAGEIEHAVLRVLAAEGADAAELSVAVVGDAEIERLNLEYLQHEGPTDVISFPLSASGGRVVGDVYVGADQARRQAAELEVPLAEEVLRLAIHGTLHVLGYEHPQDEGREGSPMYERQEALLRTVLAPRAERDG